MFLFWRMQLHAGGLLEAEAMKEWETEVNDKFEEVCEEMLSW